jgi:hypothetical protein
MIQAHTCVSVRCDQCGDALGHPTHTMHFRTTNAAMTAATADGWRIGPDGQWWCTVCAPALTCQTEGHQFSPWRHPHTRNGYPAPSAYRHCRRCCRHESRPATQNGSEPR